MSQASLIERQFRADILTAYPDLSSDEFRLEVTPIAFYTYPEAYLVGLFTDLETIEWSYALDSDGTDVIHIHVESALDAAHIWPELVNLFSATVKKCAKQPELV